ncbi:hypothetical protein D3C80_2190680 [compost metagenome]
MRGQCLHLARFVVLGFGERLGGVLQRELGVVELVIQIVDARLLGRGAIFGQRQ